MWQSVEILNDFNTLTLKQIFWKRKIFFKQLEYRFLVESTKNETASFPYKTAISKANVKIERWEQNYNHKERRFASNYFFVREFCFSLETSYKALIWRTKDPNSHIRTFWKQWGFIWWCFFPVSILMKALIARGLAFRTYARHDLFFEPLHTFKHMYAFRVLLFLAYLTLPFQRLDPPVLTLLVCHSLLKFFQVWHLIPFPVSYHERDIR